MSGSSGIGTRKQRQVESVARLMKIPGGLQRLIDDGIDDGGLCQLKSGKEASVYVVACGSAERCAKVARGIWGSTRPAICARIHR